MVFTLSLGLNEIPKNSLVVTRKAIKGVLIKNNKILLIKTNKGDYKIPGGGLKDKETAEECLKREFREETGYKAIHIGELIGTVSEKNLDIYEPDKYFSMMSEYYLCHMDNESQDQLDLDEYEKEQQFKPEFVDIREAIQNNEKILQSSRPETMNTWVKRELLVLKKIMGIMEKNEQN